MKKRVGEPWMPAGAYGRSLPAFSANLLVRKIDSSVAFYQDVLGADISYVDPDFAALRIAGAHLMLHTDHAYDMHPWHSRLTSNEGRGLGAELRIFGIDPDAVEARARATGAVIVVPVRERGHGWREVVVEDPDGYLWAVGVPA